MSVMPGKCQLCGCDPDTMHGDVTISDINGDAAWAKNRHARVQELEGQLIATEGERDDAVVNAEIWKKRLDAIERERDTAQAEIERLKELSKSAIDDAAKPIRERDDYARIIEVWRKRSDAKTDRIAELEAWASRLDEAFRMMRREALVHECGPTPSMCLVCNIISDADELAAPAQPATATKGDEK